MKYNLVLVSFQDKIKECFQNVYIFLFIPTFNFSFPDNEGSTITVCVGGCGLWDYSETFRV